MLKHLLIFAISAPLIYIAIALLLIISNPPIDLNAGNANATKSLEFSDTQSQDMSALAPLQSLEITNASPIRYRYYKSNTPSRRLIVLIHGSGWHSMQYAQMANYLTDNGLGNVVTPDLRGHGEAPERRGDTDYIGQLEDDIAALVGHLKGKYNFNHILIGGHSSGGGLVIRLAGGKHGAIGDSWLLMAPFLKYNAPTMRENSGGWAKALVRRTIGLTMLNNVAINALNHLTSIQFNMPESVRNGPLGHTATLAYSFRLNTSYAPRSDYEKDIAAIAKPMLLLVGSKDEAFRADMFEPTLSGLTDFGEYQVLSGLGHLNLTHSPLAFSAIKNWLNNN